MKCYAVFEIPDEIVKDPDALKCGAVIYESERFDEKEVISFERTKLQRMLENPAKEVKAPPLPVKETEGTPHWLVWAAIGLWCLIVFFFILAAVL